MFGYSWDTSIWSAIGLAQVTHINHQNRIYFFYFSKLTFDSHVKNPTKGLSSNFSGFFSLLFAPSHNREAKNPEKSLSFFVGENGF
jgi:hypothetical protein